MNASSRSQGRQWLVRLVTTLTGVAAAIGIVRFFTDTQSLRGLFAVEAPSEIREATAFEVESNLNTKKGRARDDAFHQLYEGKRVRRGGWSGKVVSLPDRNQGEWQFEFQEEGTGTGVVVRGAADASRLRAGDRVVIRGVLASFASGVLVLRQAAFDRID